MDRCRGCTIRAVMLRPDLRNKSRGENTVKKNPGLVNIVTGGKVEKRAALRSSAIICFPKRIKGRKGVVNCRMK